MFETELSQILVKLANNDLYSDKNNILDALQLLKESLDGADANIADRMKKCIDARQFDEIKSFADLSSGIHNLVEVLSVYDVYSSNEHYPDGFTISNTTRSIERDKEVHLDMDLKKTSPYRIRIGNDTYDNPSEAWTSLVEIVVDVLSAKNQSKMMMLVHDFTARKACCLKFSTTDAGQDTKRIYYVKLLNMYMYRYGDANTLGAVICEMLEYFGYTDDKYGIYLRGYDGQKDSDDKYFIGSIVNHKKFGRGRIVRFEPASSEKENDKVIIHFMVDNTDRVFPRASLNKDLFSLESASES